MQGLSNVRLLIAEDSAVLRERLVTLAREHLPANSICSVATGMDAVAVFDRSNPDAVLLDLALPDMSGFEVLERIRRRGTSTEVIVFTNYAGPEMAARCRSLGADHFFSKADDVGPIIDILKTIAAPGKPHANAGSEAASGTSAKQPTPALTHRSAGFDPIAVLVIEDDRFQAEPLLKLLRPKLPRGSSVTHASSRAEALEQLRARRFEVVLLDLGLPDSDGVEVVEVLRDAVADLAIIVLSAREDDHTVEAAMHAGADDYFIKGELEVAGVARAIISAAKGKRAARALTSALESRRRMMDSSADVICTLDATGAFVEVGAACERLWGYKREELIGRLVTEWIVPTERAQSEEILKAVQRGASTHEFENSLVRKDGTSIPMGWSAVWSAQDRLMYCVARDATERKRNEETLRATIESALDCIVTIDESDTILEFNPAAEQTFGLSRAEAVGRPLSETIIPPRSREGHRRGMARLLATGQPRVIGRRIEITALRSNGAEFPIELTVIQVGTDRPARFTAFIRDISERVAAREQLEAQEEQYRVLFDGNPNAMWVYHAKSLQILAVNEAAIAQYGYSRDELLSFTLFDLRPAEERERLASFINAGAKRGPTGIWQHTRKDGSVLLVDVFSRPTVFKGQNARIAVLFDVTEKTEAEEKLSRSYQLLEAVTEGTSDAVFAKGADGRYLMINTAGAQVLGRKPADVIGCRDSEFFEGAALERVLARDRGVISTGERDHEEQVVTLAGGITRTFFSMKAPLRKPTGEIVGVVGYSRDISERKKAETALRESEERFSSAFEFAPMGMAIADLDGRWVRVNQALCDLLGYSSADLTGKSFKEVTHEKDRGKDSLIMRRLLAEGGRFHHSEKRYVHKDGHNVWVFLGVSLVRNDVGEPLHFIAQMQDISERKLAEEALVASERDLRALSQRLEAERARLATAQAVAKIGSWETNLLSHAVTWSAETYRIFGVTRNEFPSTYEAFLQLVHPADRADVGQALNDSDGDCRVEHRIVSPGEGIKHVEERWEIIRDAEGKPTRATGTCQDITDRKRAELELETLNKQLVEASRQAGMAEVATSVLHNIGNVLNSVNVSCSVISETVRKSRIVTVNKTAELLRQHADDLPAFLTTNPAGVKLPELLGKLAQRLADEQSTVLNEAQALTQNVEHIKDIVAVQQSYAQNLGGLRETLQLELLVEDALRMNGASLIRHRVEVVREFEKAPAVSLEKHKVLQILVNLIRNAKHALTDSPREDKQLVLRIRANEREVSADVADNGVGIAPENMTRIFAHGFTTKKDGHGFGLHSGALAAQEMGGTLTVQSDGLGHGAVFTLILPISPDAKGSHLEPRQP